MAKRAPINPRVAAPILRHQLDLLRLEASTRAQALRLLTRMNSELLARLQEGELTQFGKRRVNALLAQSEATIVDYFWQIQGKAEDAMRGAAGTSARQAARAIDRGLAVASVEASLPANEFMAKLVSDTMVMGAPSAEWWERQAADTTRRFSDAVRQGLVAGDTNEQIGMRVRAAVDVSRNNARSLIHASIQEVANEARRETFKKNDDLVEGTRQVSTLDSSTTDICMAYDGAEFDLDGDPLPGTELPYDGGVPRHWGCRSVEVPITKTFKELGVDLPEPPEGERASADGPVPASFTFSDFLESHTAEEQDEMLGKGRAQLWRDGKITLVQLLDQRGNPLSLAELERKYG